MIKSKVSSNETSFIISNMYEGYSFLKDELNIDENRLLYIIKKLKIKYNKPLWSNSNIQFIIDNYNDIRLCCRNLKYSEKEIVTKIKWLGLTDHNNWLNRYRNIKCLSNFEVYLLGYIWADGHVRSNGIVSINAIKEDMELLKNNVELLDQNWKFNNNKKNLVISNSTIELGRILNNYGFDIKSHFQPTKLIKELDINQLKYFFLGLSDGDGSWYMNKKQGIYQYAIYSTYDQEWEYIENIFSKLNIKFSIQRIIRKNINSKSSCIRITNKLDVIKWGNYLYNNYNNDNIGLLRKYNKYISMF